VFWEGKAIMTTLKPRMSGVAICVLTVATLTQGPSGQSVEVAASDAFAWPTITRECRPWAYNWWLGSAVDRNNLARELQRYHEAGLGGIHIIPIYGAKGAEARYIQYLSPEWREMLGVAVAEAGRRGIGVDMTTGTGWCFGGPNVPEQQGGWELQTKVLALAKGHEFAQQFDPGSLVALVAELDDGRMLNLKDEVPAAGRMEWSADANAARLFVVTAVPDGRNVKRAAPGGAGPMINPYYGLAMTNYLARFTEAFAKYSGPLPRAMYHDSFEYRSSWSPDLLEEFARRRGYRLEDHIPAFCGDPKADDLAARVRCDFQETLSDLIITQVFPEWIRWCHERGLQTRNQAHGAPANLLDFYALADIPETEMFGRGQRDPLRSCFDERFGEGDREPLISKFASSAAHVAGRPLVGAETGTWMAEHFCGTLEEMKCLVDLLFVSGVNHVIYHGCVYSPDDVRWPGWLFYASTQMNPRNSIWHDAPALNAYIARCQAILQSGQPDNDVALYWPLHDFWQQNAAYVSGLTVHHHDWLTAQPVGTTARALWEHGYGFDYVSDRLLAVAKAGPDGQTLFPGGSYRVVLVPPTTFLPLETLRMLLALAENGAVIVFEGQLPRDVPGWAKVEERRASLKQLLQPLAAESGGATGSLLPPVDSRDQVRPTREVPLGKGRVVIGELEDALNRAGVRREALAEYQRARFIRRRHETGRHYFIANQSTNLMAGWFALATPAKSVVVLDPLTGRTGVARVRSSGNTAPEIQLRLEPGQSILLRTFHQRQVTGPRWRWTAPGTEVAAITGPWKVKFVAGGPALPKPYETAELKSWTANGDPETERFSGTAVYRTTFDKPPGSGPWLLDLGVVCHSARVRLNGQDRGTLFMPPYRVLLPALKPGRNALEVEVTNLSANRIRDLDRHGVSWRIFHDINFVNINYRPFNASHWPVFDSGLLGPVTLRAAETAELE